MPYPLTQRPQLSVVAVGGKAVVAGTNLGHHFQNPGVSLPAETALTVELEATFVPTGLSAKVAVNTIGGGRSVVDTTPLEGTFEASTATAEITIPAGVKVGLVEAWLPSIPVPE